MRKGTMFVFVFTASLSAVSPPAAQAQDFKRVHVSLGGGWTAPSSDVSDRLGQGYNFNFGVDVAVNPVVAIEGLYSFNGFGEKFVGSFDVADTPGGPTTKRDFFGNMNMQYGTASVILQRPEGGVRPFGLVGMGIYYRPMELTTPGVGYLPGYCDPWWYYCVPGGWVPVENVVGERSSTDFGMSFGGGVRFGAIYAELRYHYVWGPKVEELPSDIPDIPIVNPPRTDLIGKNANGQFLATTFGVRF